MINGKSVIAVVPARAGSKGLPNKNLAMLCGKPLCAWSIECGQKSQYVDEVVVSTDSPEIAAVSMQYGATVPFLRPSHLASDTATSYSAIEHTVTHYRDILKTTFDYVVMLEPTSPLRTNQDVDRAIAQLVSTPHAEAIVGVCRVEAHHPAFLVRCDSDRFIAGYSDPAMTVLRRQDIEELYFFEGSLYISHTEALLRTKTFYHSRTLAYEVPKWKSFEVDDPEDLVIIEALMRSKELAQ